MVTFFNDSWIPFSLADASEEWPTTVVEFCQN